MEAVEAAAAEAEAEAEAYRFRVLCGLCQGHRDQGPLDQLPKTIDLRHNTMVNHRYPILIEFN